ncbi:MAG: YbhB/YbcL family Raf kinase inhibitor-like protein [Candidatus Omnitrophica bacterium]|nr:YbhB/YbcL family Raf kinase inhibitor-like protein [Candidatus Omnitrophota bacterium]
MKLTSPHFLSQGNIPSRFTCQGEDVSPALEISGVPEDAKSLVLIVDDPDAPMGVWDHWIVFNINPKTKTIPDNTIPGLQGKNSSGGVLWGGPCPPFGTHRYFFKIYALDVMLELKEGAKRPAVEGAMQGHVIDKAELVGLYKKS